MDTCPAGKRCDFICENGVLVIDCIAPVANPAMAGDSCGGSDAGASTGSSCGTGTGCFGSTSKGPTCYRYCNAGSTCPAGTKCDTTTKFHAACTRTGGNLPVGLCR